MKVLILGGTGLLGTMFCDQMSKLGIVALPIGRSTKNSFKIGQKANRALFEEIDVVIYLSWMFDTTKKNYINDNFNSLKEVLEICKYKNIKLFFASTVFASESAASKYNTAKGSCEKLVLEYNQKIIKFGAVFDEIYQDRGFYGKILLFYKKFKFLPKILPNKKIFYKTNSDDISNFLKQFLTSKKNIYRCYQSPPEKMVDIFNFRKKILTIPIPWFVLYIILKSFEILKFNTGFRSDSILSIWGKSGVNEKIS